MAMLGIVGGVTGILAALLYKFPYVPVVLTKWGLAVALGAALSAPLWLNLVLTVLSKAAAGSGLGGGVHHERSGGASGSACAKDTAHDKICAKVA